MAAQLREEQGKSKPRFLTSYLSRGLAQKRQAQPKLSLIQCPKSWDGDLVKVPFGVGSGVKEAFSKLEATQLKFHRDFTSLKHTEGIPGQWDNRPKGVCRTKRQRWEV